MGDSIQRAQPRGVPGVGYVRVLIEGDGPTAHNIDIDGNSVTVISDTEPRARFDGNHTVLPMGLNDEEACENVIGVNAGEGTGARIDMFMFRAIALFHCYWCIRRP